MIDLNYFQAIQGAKGCKTNKDRKVAQVVNRFGRAFDDSINVVYDATKNDVKQDFIITPTKEKNKFTVFTRPNELISIGDIIYWNKLHWLVIDKAFDDEIYNTGTIVRCNRTIKWQDPISKIIHERWCLCNNPYSSNISDGNVISTLDGKYEVKLPYDTETIKVGSDKRFILDIVGGNPMVYKLTFPDVDSNKYQDIDGGFIIWNLVSDQYNPTTDNLQLMIADYIAPDTPPSPPDPSKLKCVISGRDSIRVGYTRKYTATFYDINNQVVSNIQTKWQVVANPDLEQYYTITPNGNLIDISIAENESLIGTQFKILLTDTNNLYSVTELTVNVVSAI